MEILKKSSERQEADKLLDEVLKDPQFKKEFLNKISELVNKHLGIITKS